jgi:3-deoxy-D-manno-octulosonic acid kinase
MKPTFHSKNSQVIVYDADRIPVPLSELFDPGYWKSQGRVSGTASGRGEVLLLETDSGPAVLRSYLRGGWPRHISHDRYVFTGFKRSRPLREFNVLAALVKAGLPAPAPLAAQCLRSGLFYRGHLLMQRIPAKGTLADKLEERFIGESVWEDTGACIRRFHEGGLDHADLNARNILLAEDNGIYLLDFDRAGFTPGRAVNGSANLRRLRRSMLKLWPGGDSPALNTVWEKLLRGYHG